MIYFCGNRVLKWKSESMTRNKISCFMRDWASRWIIAKNVKIPWSYVKYYHLMNHPGIFFDYDNDAKLGASFFSFCNFLVKNAV